jgi:hypothetical protein
MLTLLVIIPELLEYNNYWPSIYIILATIRIVEVTESIWENVCRFYTLCCFI